jgi:hypothetical protein
VVGEYELFFRSEGILHGSVIPVYGPNERIVALPSDFRPTLIVLIAVEEEFDWAADFDRNSTAVSSVARLEIGQRLFDEFGIRPALAVTYPVASQPASAEVLRSLVDRKVVEVGAHLHPWVTPPHEEQVTAFNSYPGNLPPALERAKLQALNTIIEQNLGAMPRFYHAGRYGLGRATAGIVEDLGFDVDLSCAPPLDFREDGGPDFSRFGSDPRWFGSKRRLLAIPTSGAFVGAWRWRPDFVYGAIKHRALAWAHLPGLFARLGLLERLRLSPEDYREADHRRLTEAMSASGQRIFVFYFHSPTLQPNCTVYTRSEADVAEFIQRCRRYFAYFRDVIGGEFATPSEVAARLQGADRS